MSLPKSAIVIGAGIGGLATANLLAKKGIHVTLIEQHDSPGGRARQYKQDGFTFDMGPSWYLMPDVFENYYHLLGEDIKNHLELVRLSPGYKVFFESGEQMVVTGLLDKDASMFDQIEPGAGNSLKKYVKQAGKTYHIALDNFLYTNFDRKTRLANKKVITKLPSLLKSLTRPLHEEVSRYIKDPSLQKLLEYHMVFLGSTPYEAPSMYHLMSYLDFEQGVYYPKGGLYQIVASLEKIGKNLGVDYIYNEKVNKIIVKDGHARGVLIDGSKKMNADIVVSNSDLYHTETKLLDSKNQTYPASYWSRKQPSSSAVLMYLGVKGELPELDHHNLFFINDWKGGFDRVMHDDSLPRTTSIYVCKSSHSDSSVAPPGYENVFMLVPIPPGLKLTKLQLNQAADRYLKQVAEWSSVKDLDKRIVHRRVLGPDYFANDYYSIGGSMLGLSHTLRQSALFRPSNKSKKVNNLYYVGGNTIPGIGVPLCLIGAELVYKRLIGDTSLGHIKELIQ